MNEDVQMLNAIIHHLKKTGNVEALSNRDVTTSSCSQEVKWDNTNLLITVQRIIPSITRKCNA